MRRPTTRYANLLWIVSAVSLAWSAAAADLPPPISMVESPWNGDWIVSTTRNAKYIQDDAAPGYRFHLGKGGDIRWEIPALREVVTGRTDGVPMMIRRPLPTTLSLAVTTEGPYTLLYKVFRGSRPEGEGRMTLVDRGAAWVDVSQPAGRPDLAEVVVYVRPPIAAK